MKVKNINEHRTMKRKEVFESLDIMLAEVNRGVSPSPRMIRFYNIIGRLPRTVGIPLLLTTSMDAWKVLVLAGVFQRTDAALQVIYSHKIRPWRLFWALGDALWQGAFNCRSVRARGLFTREAISILLWETQKNLQFSRKSVIASIGSGSALQLLNGIKNNELADHAHLILVDRDKKALNRGRKNADKVGIKSVEFQEKTVGGFLEKNITVDIIEMIGLTDYFAKKHLVKYFKKIYKTLNNQGFFVGANITAKDEFDYAHGVVCWPSMHYREEEELVILLREAGFENIWTERCGLYTTWIAQK